MHLHGAVVAITGAGSGIGRALALACQSRGARVSICDLDEVGLAQTHSMLGSQGCTHR
ncbi:MAG: SDR family NAD(P)-dependent oxidoreductase [Marmoricola sp.]